MTMQVSKTIGTTDKVALDAPIFDPVAFRLSDEQADIVTRAREIGQSVFAARAATYDREATFPIAALTPAGRPLSATCTASVCSALPFPRNTVGSARTTRPMLWRPPRSAAIAARPR